MQDMIITVFASAVYCTGQDSFQILQYKGQLSAPAIYRIFISSCNIQGSYQLLQYTGLLSASVIYRVAISSSNIHGSSRLLQYTGQLSAHPNFLICIYEYVHLIIQVLMYLYIPTCLCMKTTEPSRRHVPPCRSTWSMRRI